MRNPAEPVIDSFALCGRRAIFRWSGQLARHRFPAQAEILLSGFRKKSTPSIGNYAEIFRYFMLGFTACRSRLGAHANYAGMQSYNGPWMDRLEGFSRIVPLAAAWLHGQRASDIQLLDEKSLDLTELIRAGVLAGTDPASPEYWGPIGHWGQAIVEAADIALALWLARDHVWRTLSQHERTQVSRWLNQVNGKRIPDNNWHLFVVQVNAVLAALGEPHDERELELHYQRIKDFYRGSGWFRDGLRNDAPGFDYYNAWGFHYQLQWLRRITPQLDGDFIDAAFREFVTSYPYLISPKGLPMLGRSACYRMAAPAPFIFAQAVCPELVSPGLARRALDVVWQYFIQHEAVREGNVTQGYLGPDSRLVEDYSGPASCLWSLRSLVAAFALRDEHSFWQAQPEPLPVEQSDYRVAIGPTGWTACGDRATGVVTIETGSAAMPCLKRQKLADRLLGTFSKAPRRPKNTEAKYHRARYASNDPYGLGNNQHHSTAHNPMTPPTPHE